MVYLHHPHPFHQKSWRYATAQSSHLVGCQQILPFRCTLRCGTQVMPQEWTFQALQLIQYMIYVNNGGMSPEMKQTNMLDVCVQCLPCRMIDPKLIQVYHVDEAKCVNYIIGWSTWTHTSCRCQSPSKSPWHPSDWESKAAIAASLNTSTAFCGNVEKLACLSRYKVQHITCICTNTFRVAWNILKLYKMFGITP